MQKIVLLAFLIGAAITMSAQPQQAQQQRLPGPPAQAGSSMQPNFTVEYYYKVKWGHQEEFLALFRKNHLPLLQKQIESGRILSIAIATPRYHMTEHDRWDYRVTLVFKDAARAMEGDSAELIRQMYPDQATFKREEERRFEILEAHWDLPISDVPLEKRP
jgi:hypothetical protein